MNDLISIQIAKIIQESGDEGISYVTLIEKFPTIGNGAIIEFMHERGWLQKAIGVPQYKASRFLLMTLNLNTSIITKAEEYLHEVSCISVTSHTAECNCEAKEYKCFQMTQ